MQVMLYIIGLLNLMSIYEVLRSDIWHSKRRSVDCVKSVLMTIAITSMLMMFVCYAVFSAKDKLIEQSSLGMLVTTAAIMQSFATHQFAYMINRRKIIGNRRNGNVGKRAC